MLAVCELERPIGVAVSFGGQTPLRLAPALAAAGVPLLGDPLDAIDAAEDRGRFAAIAGELAPEWGAAADADEAREIAERIGFPVLVRPHHVHRRPRDARRALGRRARASRARASSTATSRARSSSTSTRSATARARGSPRSSSTSSRRASTRATRRACCPGRRSRAALEDELREVATAIARGVGARGLMNLQLALADGRLYVLEANPRASRTVPFVAKATGVPLVEHAVRLLLGERLADLGLPERVAPTRAWAKEAVFPSERFAGAAQARPRDALDRRGDGRRGDAPPRRTRARCGPPAAAAAAAGSARRSRLSTAALKRLKRSR